MPRPITRNTLFYGDNLTILRDYIPDDSVDLIYLDPPFNSQRTYNVLFRNEAGQESESQIAAFDDTWHWTRSAEEAYHHLVENTPGTVGQMIAAMRAINGTSQMMAYLVMMTIRLVELHRVLKSTGSLYLHCDSTASHYLKIILDTIFSPQNFVNEVIWRRTANKGDASRKFGAVHDTLLVYSRQFNLYKFTPLFAEKDDTYRERFRFDDGDGRGAYRLAPLDSPNPRPNLTYEYKGYQPPAKGWRVSREVMERLDAENRLAFPREIGGRIARKHYLLEQDGPKISDVCPDIPPLQASAAERLGYPTQKPEALLERIIAASSNEGDLILDPFCGCGTTIAAAQKLGRRWVGIDITHLSIALQKYRLRDTFSIVAGKDYDVIGEPLDISGAQALAAEDRYQFQWWALSLIQARPLGANTGDKKGKKGADGGIDGMINFIDDAKGVAKGIAKKVLVQVKSGHVSNRDIRDLAGTLDREKAVIGIFLTLESPSAPMRKEAASAGFYHSEGWGQNYPRIQILTIEDLLQNSARVEMPPTGAATFQQAPRHKPTGQTRGLFDTEDTEGE